MSQEVCNADIACRGTGEHGLAVPSAPGVAEGASATRVCSGGFGKTWWVHTYACEQAHAGGSHENTWHVWSVEAIINGVLQTLLGLAGWAERTSSE